MSYRIPLALFALVFAFVRPAVAADEQELPYWASIRVDEINMRVGPGEDYRISWVYRRPHLPLKVVRMKEGWRLVEDPDGTRGWVVGRFLSRDRGAIVRGKGLAEIHEAADEKSRLRWRIEPGVVGTLGDCEEGWCQFNAAGHKGFIREERLWGDGEP